MSHMHYTNLKYVNNCVLKGISSILIYHALNIGTQTKRGVTNSVGLRQTGKSNKILLFTLIRQFGNFNYYLIGMSLILNNHYFLKGLHAMKGLYNSKGSCYIY